MFIVFCYRFILNNSRYATRYLGILGFIILVLFNFGLFLKNGKDYFLIKHLDYIYWTIVLLKNPRLLTRKGKIDNPISIIFRYKNKI